MATTVTLSAARVRSLLLDAVRLLNEAHERLRDANLAYGPNTQIAACVAACNDLAVDVASDVERLVPQEPVTPVQETEQQPAPAILAPSVAQVTTEPAPVEADQHVTDYHSALLADCKLLGIRASRSWKAATLQAKIAAAKASTTTPASKAPEPAATARTILAPCAAQTTSEPTPDAIAERAELMAKLATLSNQELSDLVALAFPPPKAA